MLNCQWCHFQRIFVWEIGQHTEDLDLKNWCHCGRWVIEQVIPKKNRRLFLNECHFGSMSNFGIWAFHFFLKKILCQTTGVLTKDTGCFEWEKAANFTFQVFPSKVAFTEGKSRWNSSVQGAPSPSRSTEAVGDQPQSETTTWRGSWENPSGRDATQVVMKNGETMNRWNKVFHQFARKKNKTGGVICVFFFWVCVFIF